MLIMRKPFESLECRDGLYAVVDYGGREYCFTTILNSCMILFTRILLGVRTTSWMSLVKTVVDINASYSETIMYFVFERG